jgi:hypothetical protein
MNTHAFADRKKSADLEALEKVSAPIHPLLADFTRECYPDADARTAAVTTLVLSLWQVAGRRMSHRVPSLILLDASDFAPDPIDAFAARLVNDRVDTGPGRSIEGAFAFGKPENAPVAMANEIVKKHRMENPGPHNLHHHKRREDRYFAAQATGFGTARTRPYSNAWHETFGLLTNRNDELILRLESQHDCVVFRHHLLNDSEKLLNPTGYGAGLATVAKHTAISGSLTPELWDEQTATKMVELGLPFVFLPHTVREQPVIDNLPALDFFNHLLPGRFHSPVEEPANLLPVKWVKGYGRQLRARLRELPATYEYSMQRTTRQLVPVCMRVAIWAGQQSGATPAEVEALFLDLYEHTLRGLVIGIAGLAWHGLGFDTGLPRPKAMKVLKYLRDKGPVTKIELMRGVHLTKAERDTLLQRFFAEDLVRVEGKTITATTYEEFVAGLYARKEFPATENHWEEVAKAAKSAA